MLRRWEKKLNLRGPIEQAERCLALWLEEEGRHLTDRQKRRAAALMARYFHYEDEVTDQLMLSFLRHYSSQNEVDMEDPTSVRREIKAMLDKSREHDLAVHGRKRVWAAFFVGVTLMALTLGGWEFTHRKITKEQQAELKALVHQLDDRDPQATSAAIWNAVKAPLQVRSYQEITWWDYHRSREMLEKRLQGVK